MPFGSMFEVGRLHVDHVRFVERFGTQSGRDRRPFTVAPRDRQAWSCGMFIALTIAAVFVGERLRSGRGRAEILSSLS